MGRIDIRDIDDDTMSRLDAQCKKYGIKNRSEYIRLLIKLDVLTDIVERIRKDDESK